MNRQALHIGVAAVMLLALAPVRAAPPPIVAFAQGKSVVDAALSPDGHYLAVLMTLKGVRVAMVQDRTIAGSDLKPVMSSALDHKFDIGWCRWATDARLLCGLRGMVRERGFVFIATRLAAVDANGKNLKVLVQGQDAAAAYGQLQDEIVDWTPGKPDTVLIAAQANLASSVDRAIASMGGDVAGRTADEYPGIYELNVVTGAMVVRTQSHPPLREFLADHQGKIRLGWGVVPDSDQIEYDVRDSDSGVWRRLLKYQAFSRQNRLRPLAMCPGDPNCAYAIGEYEGRNALWRMDLRGDSSPTLEFSHPAVDVGNPIFSNDGRLVGVEYETDRPFVYYTDPARESVVRSLKSLLPGAFIVVRDVTRDGNHYLIRTTSDIDAGTYYLVDVPKGQASRIGSAYPDLDPRQMGRMQSISFPAQDGTSIPGYLTVAPSLRAEHLPLIVMPHGGPIYRDSWEFDFLRAFLVSRGYAVLQMNFRGSAGYGSKWFYDAHQDWGGLTYSDIADGARWAIKQGIADPNRIAIVGWSFGGYAALLGAVRDSSVFRCAVSIAGISDLSLLESQENNFIVGAIARQQIGTDSTKLKADSPRRHVADVGIPVLMIHGDADAQANVEQTRAMDRALTAAHKTHESIILEGADHQLSRESDRTAMLTALEKFLDRNIPAR